MSDIAYRRWFGALLGVGLGLCYGLVSQYINRLALPGIPIYQPPLGPLGNTLLWMGAIGLFALMGAWHAEGAIGMYAGGGLGAVMIMILTLTSGMISMDRLQLRIFILLLILIPLGGLLTILAGLLRWVVNREVEGRIDRTGLVVRAWVPLSLLALVGLIGSTARYPDWGKAEVRRMADMLQAGLQTTQTAALPEPLQSVRVGNFLDQAKGSYTLAWENQEINRFAIPRGSSKRDWEESAVIARFANDWSLVCIYPDAEAEPACKGFEPGAANSP
ncbi:MAG TPA: hypothetical protein VLA49_07210 [Anaerolineales bacterium]|nr:hypothetical protein [Anaerolineales bacterium]